MDFALLFENIYPLVPLVGLSGYVPQFRSIWSSKTALTSFSVTTWLIWLSTALVSLGYAVFSIGDLLLSLTCFMNVTAYITIILMVLYKRHQYNVFDISDKRKVLPDTSDIITVQ